MTPIPAELDGHQAEFARNAISSLQSDLLSLSEAIKAATGPIGGVPARVSNLEGELKRVEEELRGGSRSGQAATVSASHTGVLAVAIARTRRTLVHDLDAKRKRAISGEIVKRLDAEVEKIDALMRSSWYASANPTRVPRLRDFVAESSSELEAAEKIDRSGPIKRDDKFGILNSASLLTSDLAYVRRGCEDRGAPLAVAFIDVDTLKELNTEFGETVVDALVLPPIMRAVEQVAYGHGKAYRHGGDEFVIVIPSADANLALAIVSRLGRLLSEIDYGLGVAARTASVGVCVVLPDCPLIDAEVLHWAALAKQRAKDEGRAMMAVATATVTLTNPGKPTSGNSSSPYQLYSLLAASGGVQ